MPAIPRGRPRRYSQYEKLVVDLPNGMTKRPKYVDGIGVFKGAKETTAWIKVRLPKGGIFKGTSHLPGTALEIKLGKLASWTWDQLEHERDSFQGRADRGEPLEDQQPLGFTECAEDWLTRAKTRLRSYPIVQAHISKHLLPVFGSRTIDAITVSQINHWIALKLRTQKPATVKRELDTLKAILTDAVRSGHLEANPCDHVNSIRGIVGRQRFLSAEEMIRLLIAADETEEWLLSTAA